MEGVFNKPIIDNKRSAPGEASSLPSSILSTLQFAKSTDKAGGKPADKTAARPDFADLAAVVDSAVHSDRSASEAFQNHLFDKFYQRLDPERQAQYSAAKDGLRTHGVDVIQQLALLVYLGKSLGMDDKDLRRFANDGVLYAARGPGITHTTLLPVGTKDKPDFKNYHRLLESLMREIAARRDPSYSPETSLVDIDRSVSEYHVAAIRAVADNVKKTSNDKFCCVDFDRKTGKPLSHEDTVSFSYNVAKDYFPHQGPRKALYAASTLRAACLTQILDLLTSQTAALPVGNEPISNPCTAANANSPPHSRRNSMSTPPEAFPPRPNTPRAPMPTTEIAPPHTPTTTSSGVQPPTTRSLSSIVKDNGHRAAPLKRPKANPGLAEPPTQLQLSRFKWTDSEINSLRNNRYPYATAQYVLQKLAEALCNDPSDVRRQVNDLRKVNAPTQDFDLKTFAKTFDQLQRNIHTALPLTHVDPAQDKQNADRLRELASFYQSVLRQTALPQRAAPGTNRPSVPTDNDRYSIAKSLHDFIEKSKHLPHRPPLSTA